MQFKRPIASLLLLVYAFAARFLWLDAIRFGHPHVRVHAGGLVILDTIAAGQFHNLPLLGQLSNINMLNPVGASYFEALLSLFERDPYCSAAIFAMLSVLGVAMVYDLGRRLFGKPAGIVAAALAASSPWAILTAEGVWVQGLLEISAITSAWLIFVAIQQRNTRRLFVGLIVTALLMQTYLMAMLLAIQVFLMALYAWGMDRRFTKVALAGLVVCFLSGLSYLVLLYINDLNPATQLQTGLENAAMPTPSLPNPFGLHIDLAGFNHSLRIVTGLDYESEWTDPTAPGYDLRRALDVIRATVVEWAFWIGAIIAVVRLRKNVGHRLTLTWIGVPAVLLTILLIFRPNVYPSYQYMLVTSPAGYLLAGIPFGLLAQTRFFKAPKGIPADGDTSVVGRGVEYNVVNPPRRPVPGAGLAASPRTGTRAAGAGARAVHLAANGLLSAALGAAVLIPLPSLAATAEYVYKTPLDSTADIGMLPLRWQLQLGDILRTHCDELDSSEELYWANVSLYENSEAVGNGTADLRGQSDAWLVGPKGGNCIVRLPGQPIPLNAEAFPLQVAPDMAAVAYRSKPVEPFLPGDFTPLRTNLGWSLVDMETPAAAAPGELITVTHIWRIDSLPEESHWWWYYAPFVDLVRPDGSKAVSVDNAPSIIGWNWQPGDYIISTVRLTIPADEIGDYQLRLSLFDPNQKKNAVYFDANTPDQYVLAIERPLKITP